MADTMQKELEITLLECKAFSPGGLTPEDLNGVDADIVSEVSKRLLAFSKSIRPIPSTA